MLNNWTANWEVVSGKKYWFCGELPSPSAYARAGVTSSVIPTILPTNHLSYTLLTLYALYSPWVKKFVSQV